MKKLLYTFLLGLLFVACDKNDDSLNLETLSPAELTIASIPSVDLSQELVLKLVNNLVAANIPKSKTLGNANQASKSSDYQVLWVFMDANSIRYTTLLDDSNDDLCFGSLEASAIYLDNSAGDGSEISVESQDGLVSATIQGDFAAFFAGSSNALIKLTDELTPAAIAEFDENNIAAF